MTSGTTPQGGSPTDTLLGRLFERGEWERLEGELDRLVLENPDDARARYRRANLWMHLGRFSDAPAEFDIVRAQGLFPDRCTNNKGVALVYANDVVSALGEWYRNEQNYTPSAVNVAIVLDALTSLGPSVLQLIEEVRPDLAGQSLEQLRAAQKASAVRMFTQSGDPEVTDERDGGCSWEDTHGDRLDVAWVVAPASLPGGLGYRPVADRATIEEANALLWEGKARLGAQDWNGARACVERARRLHPQLEHQARDVLMDALYGELKDRLMGLRTLWWNARAEAEASMAQIVWLSAQLGDPEIGIRIGAEEVAGLAAQLAAEAPHGDVARLADWTSLSAAMVEMMDRIGLNAEPDSAGSNAVDQLRKAVESAWLDRVLACLGKPDFDAAFDTLVPLRSIPTRLDGDGWPWRLIGRVYVSLVDETERLALTGKLADATDLLERAESEDPAEFLRLVQGSDLREDPRMPELRRRIAALGAGISQRLSDHVDTQVIRTSLSSGDNLAALAEADRQLRVSPANDKVARLRRRAIAGQCLRIRSALLSGPFSEALRLADELHARAGDDSAVAELQAQAQAAWADNTVARAKADFQVGRLSRVERAVERVLRTVPGHPGAVALTNKLRRETSYRKALEGFGVHRANADVPGALQPLRELLAIDGIREESEAALRWFVRAVVAWVHAETLRSRRPGAARQPDCGSVTVEAIEMLEEFASGWSCEPSPNVSGLRDLLGQWHAWSNALHADRSDLEAREIEEAIGDLSGVFGAPDPIGSATALLEDKPWIPRQLGTLSASLAAWLERRAEAGAIRGGNDPAALPALLTRLRCEPAPRPPAPSAPPLPPPPPPAPRLRLPWWRRVLDFLSQ